VFLNCSFIFVCVLYYLDSRAAVSVVSTLSFLFITCDLENVMFYILNEINDNDDEKRCCIIKSLAQF